jgi:hypothetical protein
MRDNCVISSEKGLHHIIARTEFLFFFFWYTAIHPLDDHNEIDVSVLDQQAELDLYSAST